MPYPTLLPARQAREHAADASRRGQRGRRRFGCCGSCRRARRRRGRRLGHAARARRARRRYDGDLRRRGVDPREPPRGSRPASTTRPTTRSATSAPSARATTTTRWCRSSCTTRPTWRARSRSAPGCAGRCSPTGPTTRPASRAAAPADGRSGPSRWSCRPRSRAWSRRHPNCLRRAASDGRTTDAVVFRGPVRGRVLVGALLEAVLERGVTRRGRRGGGRPPASRTARCAVSTPEASIASGASSSPPAAFSTTPISPARSSPDRPTRSRRWERRAAPATRCAGPPTSASRSATCPRRGGCPPCAFPARRSTASPSTVRCTTNARNPARSWSTAKDAGSSTRRRTTETWAGRCCASTPGRSATRRRRAGSSSTRRTGAARRSDRSAPTTRIQRGCTRPTTSTRSATRSASRRARWRGPLPGSTPTPRAVSTRGSGAVTTSTTVGSATHARNIRPSPPWCRRRSSRSRSGPDASGTKGGPRTDASGRVRRNNGGVVDGLYAAGNAAASPFGIGTAGGGSTIGPALVFGTRAGVAAATDATRQTEHE